MAQKPKKPLVAEKRTPKRKPVKAKKKPVKKKPVKRAAAKKRTKPKGNIVSRGFRWVFHTIFRTIWWFGLRLGLIGTALMAAWIGYYYIALPPMEEHLDGRAGGSVLLLDRNAKVFAWRGEQFDGSLRSTTVSIHLKNAVLATEDKRFYGHLGISPRGIASAIRINLREGRGPLTGHGGSTITQQVAKLLCLGVEIGPDQTVAEYQADCRRGSLVRKLTEIPYSVAMELKYGKDNILSIYLNRAYLGAGAQGFEAAAQRYFGKSAREVNIPESAMLAGLLTAPSRFAPTNNLQRAQDRSNVVIGLMQDQDYITRLEADLARTTPAVLSRAAQARAGGYFADWIMSDAPAFLTRDTTEDVQIRTTFDQDIQKAAEEALTYIFENRISAGSGAQAAIVVMSPDGAVRAMVGGRNIDGAGQFNRATQALRQPGSSFKPFVYANALEAGMHPFDLVLDAPITIDVPGSGPYSPKNYTHQFYGEIPLVDAMAQSLNTVAVRLTERFGRERVRAIASDFGITTPLVDGPSLALGTSEATLIEMTAAYAGILNGGRQSKSYGWIDLRLRDNTLLMDLNRPENIRVLSERTDGYLIYMMNQVVERGSGARARIEGRPVAGKTGTTQGAKDAWFIGFTGDYVAGVWMGYDDNTPLTGVTGGGLPADIWHETMVRVHEGLPVTPLPMTDPNLEAPRFQTRITDPIADARDRNLLESLIDGIFGPPRR